MSRKPGLWQPTNSSGTADSNPPSDEDEQQSLDENDPSNMRDSDSSFSDLGGGGDNKSPTSMYKALGKKAKKIANKSERLSSISPKFPNPRTDLHQRRNPGTHISPSPGKDSVKEQESARQSYDTSWLIFIIIFIIAVPLLYSAMPNSSVPSEHVVDSVLSPYGRFVSQISDLKESLPGQNQRLWRTIQASVHHIFREEHSAYPSVILVAHNRGNADLTTCLVKKIASSYDTSFDLTLAPTYFNVAELKHLTPAQQKKKLDDALLRAFNTNKQRSFIIGNLQALHPEAALLLHGYCDNDNAPHKDVMLILVLQVDENIAKLELEKPSVVENYLESLWSRGLDIDKLKAVLSRVANNIAIVGPERDPNTLNKICA